MRSTVENLGKNAADLPQTIGLIRIVADYIIGTLCLDVKFPLHFLPGDQIALRPAPRCGHAPQPCCPGRGDKDSDIAFRVKALLKKKRTIFDNGPDRVVTGVLLAKPGPLA